MSDRPNYLLGAALSLAGALLLAWINDATKAETCIIYLGLYTSWLVTQ